MDSMPDYSTSSPSEKRREVVQLITLARQAISRSGKAASPLDQYLELVAEAFSEPDDNIREQKFEALQEEKMKFKDIFDKQSYISESNPNVKKQLLALADQLEVTGQAMEEVSQSLYTIAESHESKS